MNRRKSYRNALGRIHVILANAAKKSADAKTSEVWKSVLKEYGYEFSQKENIRSLEIAEILALFYRELTFAWAELDDEEDQELGYPAAFESVCGALSVVNLSAQWRIFKAKITPEILTIIGISARLLPENSELDENEINSLMAELEELDKNIQMADLSTPFKRVLRYHVKVMRDALKKYSLIGANALRDALKEGIFNVQEHEQEFQENSDKPVVQSVGNAWDRLTGLYRKAKVADEASATIFSIGSKIAGALEYIDKN